MKTLVSDFDLTFYTNRFEYNIDVVNKFVLEGNTFIIATGRNAKSLFTIIDNHDIKYSYLICNDGGIIYNHNKEVITREDLDINDARRIMDILSLESDLVYIDDGYKPVLASDIANGVYATYYDKIKALNTLNKIMELFPNTYGYLSDNYINITNKKVNKASAVKFLEENFNIKNIYVVGDKINDLSLFQSYEGISIDNSINELVISSKIHLKDFEEVIEYIKKRP